MKLKELEDKVKENQKLKESVENEKELWKNKAKNLERSSAMNKPSLLSQYNKKWTTPTKQEITDMNLIPRNTETLNRNNLNRYNENNSNEKLNKFSASPNKPAYASKGIKFESNFNSAGFNNNPMNNTMNNNNDLKPRISYNINPFPNNNNPYAERNLKDNNENNNFNNIKNQGNYGIAIPVEDKKDILNDSNNSNENDNDNDDDNNSNGSLVCNVTIDNNENENDNDIRIPYNSKGGKSNKNKYDKYISDDEEESDNNFNNEENFNNSFNSESDGDGENENKRIDPRKIFNKKVIVQEINSDVENLSQKYLKG